MHHIRPALTTDLEQLVALYNHYIANSHYTFDTEPYTVETRRPWLEQFDGRRYRCLVVEDRGQVLGYASSCALKPKPAYGTSIEVSVYLTPDSAGRGLGRALYTALFDTLVDEDLHRAYALIALPNPASIALHTSFGFRQAAHLHEVGRKFGIYWDVVYLEKVLGQKQIGGA